MLLHNFHQFLSIYSKVIRQQ